MSSYIFFVTYVYMLSSVIVEEIVETELQIFKQEIIYYKNIKLDIFFCLSMFHRTR
jgi:hypothetical protein